MESRVVIATILLGFCTVTASCSAKELPIAEYIDATVSHEYSVPQYQFTGELIDKYGSENPDGTLKFLKQFLENTRKLIHEKALSREHEDDKYNVKTEFDHDGQLELVNVVGKLIFVAEKPELYRSAQFFRFLDMILVFFGDDLGGFASGQVSHHKKLHAFLSDYIKAALSANLARLVELATRLPLSYVPIDDIFERFVSYDLNPGYTEDQLIDRAQKMDLLGGNFDGHLMLEKIGNLDWGIKESPEDAPFKLLTLKLEKICSSFRHRYGSDLEIYTWSRLLIPEKLSDASPSAKLRKLAEYWRICSPIKRREKHFDLLRNVSRNMPSLNDASKRTGRFKILDIFRSKRRQ